MTEVIERTKWSEFLRTFGQRNEGKPTRLGMFETTNGSANDYWIEDGLPLMGLDSYSDKGKIRIDILFEKYTHSIDDAEILVNIDSSDSDQGLDISDNQGRTTVLRFENWVVGSEDN